MRDPSDGTPAGREPKAPQSPPKKTTVRDPSWAALEDAYLSYYIPIIKEGKPVRPSRTALPFHSFSS
jgi:hypothetical protein